MVNLRPNHQISIEALERLAKRRAERAAADAADLEAMRLEMQIGATLGTPVARLAAAAGISRDTAYRWITPKYMPPKRGKSVD